MAVPKMIQLQRGIGVNIVQKQDQRSGRLTTGQIADVLTKGDHPRGIKVRLTNGMIGRVQSLTTPTTSFPSTSSAVSCNPTHGSAGPDYSSTSLQINLGRGRMVQGVRQDLYDTAFQHQPSSLFDYLRPSKQRKPADKTRVCEADKQAIPQDLLKTEYPNIDSALIAAIIADYPDVDGARGVLKTL